LKEPKLAQLDKWFTAMHSKGKPVPGPVIFGKAESLFDEMKTTD
jgi:hypothetical protein